MKTMATLIIALLALGCGKGKEAPKPEPAIASGAPATPPDAAAAPGADYDSHMKAGEALENQKKWSEALAEFEAALVAKPDDARALTEIGFTAYFAGNLPRAKEASEAAAMAAKDDKLRGAALFNLGLAIEKTSPHAAAALFAESNAKRPNATVAARLAKLQRNEPKKIGTPTPEGDALLAKLGVKPAKLPPAKPAPKPVDAALMDALEAAGVEWESGAGKSALAVSNLSCVESMQDKPYTYRCTSPVIEGKVAQTIVDNLKTRKVAPVKEHGDVVKYEVAQVKCTSLNEGDSKRPDVCEVTK